MYAIVNISGKQYKVEQGKFIYTNRLEGAEGSAVEFSEVLLLGGEGTQIGTPHISGAKVSGTILSHLKDDKVLVFKKKRRKGYKKMNGHRQALSKVMIEKIVK
jgi:large subunit ribosomal protein L21